jgi:hypothetical protein
MSLIKAVDVPKHLADRLLSRRIAARLSGGAAKPVLVKKSVVSPEEPPAPELLRARAIL